MARETGLGLLSVLAIAACTNITNVYVVGESSLDAGLDAGAIEGNDDAGYVDAGSLVGRDAGRRDAGRPDGGPGEHHGSFDDPDDCDPVSRIHFGTPGRSPGPGTSRCTVAWKLGSPYWVYPPEWEPYAVIDDRIWTSYVREPCSAPSHCMHGYYCDQAEIEYTPDGRFRTITEGVCRPYCWPSEGRTCFDMNYDADLGSGHPGTETNPENPGTCELIDEPERGVTPIRVGVCRPRE